MNNHPDERWEKPSAGDEVLPPIERLESRCKDLMVAIQSLQHELHDGLSQQIVGIAMMAARLAEDLKVSGSDQTDTAEHLSLAIRDAKRQTFALAARLKQIASDFPL